MNDLDDAERLRWFAVRTKPRSEKVVAAIAQSKGLEPFVPLYQCRRRWSDRFKSVDLPLFPGYVFCRLNPEYRLPVLTIPGVLHFVGLGKIPAPIEDTEIAAIQNALRSGLLAEPWEYLEVGQRVRIEEGPLSGLEGLLVEVRKKHRIVVSISLLKRSMAIEIERHWAWPVDSRGQRVQGPFKPPSVCAAVS